MTGIVKKLGSVWFTAVISVLLIILLTVSTSMEAIHGTPFAQKFFYQTRWFDFLISLLWINIFCSTVVRYPFKKSQVGFLITHVAILGLLIGALITRTHSIDGQVSLYEGETTDLASQTGYAIAAIFPNQEDERFDLHKGLFDVVLTKDRLNTAAPFCSLVNIRGPKASAVAGTDQKLSFTVTQILEHAVRMMRVTDGKAENSLNQAVQVMVKSRNLNLDTSVWLVAHDAENPASTEALAGPVQLKLSKEKKPASTQKPILHIIDATGKELLTVDISQQTIPRSIVIPKTDLTIKDLAFYPYAAVAKDKKIVNAPEGRTPNPAIDFDLLDKKGGLTHLIRFAFFPEFESMHASAKQVNTDLKFKFEAGSLEDQQQVPQGLQIRFLYNDAGALRYESHYQDKILATGSVTPGTCTPALWMDVEFCTQQVLSRARVAYEIVPSTDDQGILAATVTVPSASGAENFWVFENNTTTIPTPKARISFTLTAQTFKLPFSLQLKKFRKIDYPGTDNPSAFESDVVLHDTQNGVSLERTISMNRPLLYDGFKIFQSSYMQDPQNGNGSVFTVAKNPGIPWIYIGSIMACIGALFQFYGVKEKGAA